MRALIGCRTFECCEFPFSNNMEDNSPLEQLNIDCLHHIFQFLNLQDIYYLNCLSTRFRECTKRFLSKQEIDFMQLAYMFYYRQQLLRDILDLCGDVIKRVIISPDNAFLHLLFEYCSNIEYLRIDLMTEDSPSWWSFLGRMQSLRSLFICNHSEYARYQSKFFPAAIDEIVKLHNLESLRIHKASIDGSRLDELRNLKELDLSNCQAVTNEHFINAFRANRNLTKINIHGCTMLNRKAYRCMAVDSRLIETLECDDNLLNRGFIPGLNHLQHLTLHRFGNLLFSQYLQACSQTLTSLTCHYCEVSIPETVVFPNLIELSVYEGSFMDVLLRGLYKNCPRLEKLTAAVLFDHTTLEALLDFFRTSKNVVFVKLQIWNCFSINLYKDIVAIRSTFDNRRTLKLVVYGEGDNAKLKRINLFMKGKDYAALREYVEMELAINTYMCRRGRPRGKKMRTYTVL